MGLFGLVRLRLALFGLRWIALGVGRLLLIGFARLVLLLRLLARLGVLRLLFGLLVGRLGLGVRRLVRRLLLLVLLVLLFLPLFLELVELAQPPHDQLEVGARVHVAGVEREALHECLTRRQVQGALLGERVLGRCRSGQGRCLRPGQLCPAVLGCGQRHRGGVVGRRQAQLARAGEVRGPREVGARLVERSEAVLDHAASEQQLRSRRLAPAGNLGCHAVRLDGGLGRALERGLRGGTARLTERGIQALECLGALAVRVLFDGRLKHATQTRRGLRRLRVHARCREQPEQAARQEHRGDGGRQASAAARTEAALAQSIGDQEREQPGQQGPLIPVAGHLLFAALLGAAGQQVDALRVQLFERRGRVRGRQERATRSLGQAA